MTKSQMNVLGKIFMAEIEDRLPWQGKSNQLNLLEANGWIRPMSRLMGNGWPQIKVTGWALTEAGRYAYCSMCGKSKKK